MIESIKKLFGLKTTDYAELIRNGAIVLDVRTPNEFAGGHLKNAINIPLDKLSGEHSQLKNKQIPVITCCASGMRSGMAKNILKSQGFEQVFNGGSWSSLKKYQK